MVLHSIIICTHNNQGILGILNDTIYIIKKEEKNPYEKIHIRNYEENYQFCSL